MRELGPDSAQYHREVGEHARESGVELLIGVGELARDYAPDEWALSPAEAVPVVRELLGEGDAILVKGSRAVGLEAFTEELVR
jgi:UDP-N-acetylmuramyl pentapeptide synthase